MKTAFFDIETTGFDKKRDQILVVCFSNSKNDKVTIIEHGDEGELSLIEETVAQLIKYERIVSWSGDRFDVPFLQYRASKHGISFGHINHIDLCRIARNKFKKAKSYSLDAFSKSFKTDDQKTPFSMEIWQQAINGDEEAMEYIIEHCVQDVVVLKQLWNAIME